MAGKLLSVGVGWSTKPDAIRAGKEAAEAARERASGAPPRLAFAFGSSWFEQPQLLEGIRSVLGELPVVGGSTAGEIGPHGPLSHSCVVMLLGSDALACSMGAGEHADREPRKAGQQAAYAAARQFPATAQRTGFLMFGDGLVSGYGDVVRGMQEVLGTGAVIVGGTAGDDLRFARTCQYAGRRVISGGVTGALVGGLGVGVGLEHGFSPISRPRRITRAKGNVLYQLDGAPAASVYEEYFGAQQLDYIRQERMSRRAVAYPLGLQNAAGTQWSLRNVIDFHADGSLACSGEMLEGGSLQLMIGSRQLALEAARTAAQRAVRAINRVAGVLVFDSAARKTLLGPRHAELELRGIREVIGSSTPMAGCYTYGEQAVFGQGSVYDRTTIQTGSVLVVALGDA